MQLSGRKDVVSWNLSIEPTGRIFHSTRIRAMPLPIMNACCAIPLVSSVDAAHLLMATTPSLHVYVIMFACLFGGVQMCGLSRFLLSACRCFLQWSLLFHCTLLTLMQPCCHCSSRINRTLLSLTPCQLWTTSILPNLVNMNDIA